MVNSAKMFEPLDVPFGMLSHVNPRNHVLDGGQNLPMGRGNFEGEGHAPTCPTTF